MPRFIADRVSSSKLFSTSPYSNATSAHDTKTPGGSVAASGVNCTNCASKIVPGVPHPRQSIGTSANAFPSVPCCGARSLYPPVCSAKTRLSRHASPNHDFNSLATAIVAPPEPMRAPGGSVITTYRSRAPGSAPRAWRWSKRARNARVWDALEDVRATTSQNAPGAITRSGFASKAR